MAYVALVSEGEGAQAALDAVIEARGKRSRILTRTPGACVLYDRNMAREFVRDVKQEMTSGKLYVFRLEEPQEVFEAGGEAP